MHTSRMMRLSGVTLAVVVAVCLPAGGAAQQPADKKPAAGPQAAKAAIYDAKADGRTQIAAALTKAKRENQRVLVMFGGNWCGWCRKLHGLFTENREIARTLLYEYQLVPVDVGRFDKHMDIARGYGADLKKAGVPFLTVLDAEGKVLVNQETGALEAGERHDPQKVAAFLDKWKAKPLDAEKLLASALEQATAEQKSVFLHLGAPWCPWCRRLDDFLARPQIAEILSQDYIELKIDLDRMTSGKRVAQRIRGSSRGGIPWFAILDGKGKTLATSDGPKGNVGFPVEPFEISHFVNVLKRTAKRLSAEQISTIEQALRDSATKLKSRRRGGG